MNSCISNITMLKDDTGKTIFPEKILINGVSIEDMTVTYNENINTLEISYDEVLNKAMSGTQPTLDFNGGN